MPKKLLLNKRSGWGGFGALRSNAIEEKWRGPSERAQSANAEEQPSNWRRVSSFPSLSSL